MPTVSAASTAAMKLVCAMVAGVLLANVDPAKADWNKPWQAEDRALVVDAYEFNPIDWQALTSDKRIAGFINKASDGLPPEWNCKGKSGDDELLCKNRWWKYSVTKELYMTRRAMAKTLGLKWGAYHLARPGNPREQADHFVDFAEPAEDDLIAIDIEDNTSEWMSLADAEIFANQIFIRTGRYPVLYTNGSTAKWISDYHETYQLLSRLPLWYARYRDDITGVFPEETWSTYSLWQFSSMHNCSQKKCPYRVKGAKSDIDVNVSPLDVAGLRAAWPFKDLVKPLPAAGDATLVAGLSQTAGRAVDRVTDEIAGLSQARAHLMAAVAAVPAPVQVPAQARPAVTLKPAVGDTMLAAYGPATTRHRVDPLQLLTEAAEAEQHGAAAKPAAPAPAQAAALPATVPTPKPVLSAGQPVQVASLGSLAGLRDEMRAVAAIVPKRDSAKGSAAVVPVLKGTAFGAAERSKFSAWLKASQAERTRSSLSMPAYVLSQDSSDDRGRGARPAAARRRSLDAAFLSAGPVEQRIAGAFQATR